MQVMEEIDIDIRRQTSKILDERAQRRHRGHPVR
jgi:hypothetical protein